MELLLAIRCIGLPTLSFNRFKDVRLSLRRFGQLSKLSGPLLPI